MRYVYLFLFYVNIFFVVHSITEDVNYWRENSWRELRKAESIKIIKKKAKNVIVFVGDGMGPTTVTAARIYGKGEKGKFVFEDFDHIGLLKTYSANKLVPDSCSTATALFCGVKANQKTSGVDSSVAYNDCEASLVKSAQVPNILKWAQDAGKATGFVTTTRVTHATPSALYAHTPNRKWECESVMPENSSCKDIAKQMVFDEPGKNINVIMGGGRQCLKSNVKDSVEDPVDTWSCYSRDGRNLIEDWKEDKRKRELKYKVVENTGQLFDIDPEETDFLLGIFANGHLMMDHARDKSSAGMPSLTNMTEMAIRVLKRNENGFILVVEGGMIDFGHHRGHARQALDETVAMNSAVDKALTLTNSDETLVIVTADHSHSLIMSGYPDRTNGVLKVAQKSETNGIPYTSLLYGTGGANNIQFQAINGSVVRKDPSLEDTESFQYSQQASVETDEVTHAGTDVTVYAKGPMAHLFSSLHEQTYVAHVISFAADIGPMAGTSSASTLLTTTYLLFITLLLISI